jgi:hypothetical protein
MAPARRQKAFDLVIGAKVSPNLQSWDAIGATTTLDNGLSETVTIQESVPVGFAPKRFPQTRCEHHASGKPLNQVRSSSVQCNRWELRVCIRLLAIKKLGDTFTNWKSRNLRIVRPEILRDA